MNKIILSGWTSGDVKYTPAKGTSKSLLSFMFKSIGTKTKNGEWKNLFIKVNVWDKEADYLNDKNIVDKQLTIEGELKNNNWTDKDGKKHYDIEISALHIELSYPLTSQTAPKKELENAFYDEKESEF